MGDVVFMTGGTGALGSLIVARLLTDPGTSEVVVLTRDPARASAHIGAAHKPGCASLRFVQGDVRERDLGLTNADLHSLRASATLIVHGAADTMFSLPLEVARATNVRGTLHLLGLAATCPRVRRMACLSTVYVAGRRTGVFGEADSGDAAAGFVNSYEQTKHEMEDIVRDSMARLPIALYRSSTLAGDSRTGEVGRFNAVHHSLRLLYQGLAPMIPGRPDTLVDLVADDHAATAFHWLIRHAFEPGTTRHVCAGAGRAARLDALLDATMVVFEQARPAWRKRRVEPPAMVDLATYELFVRSVEEAGNTLLQKATRAVQSFAGQLAHPKSFEARVTAPLLDGAGLSATPVLDFYPRAVRYCLETGWGAGRAVPVAADA